MKQLTIEELACLSATKLVSGYARGEYCPEQVMDITLRQVAAVNPALHALYDVRFESSRLSAAESAARWSAGTPIGPLDGLPITVKDSIDCAGMHWFHGSSAYAPGIMANRDAPPAARLRSAGAILFGKCTMPDFGLSASGISSSHAMVRNPWGVGWSPGGSSAGGAASLAAGVAALSVGSDIAGSVRLPASHCGIAAFKPTQGLIPHTPPSTVRSAGPMCRHVSDLEFFTKILAGPCDLDHFSLPALTPVVREVRELKVGVVDDFGFGPPVEAPVIQALQKASVAIRECVASVSYVQRPFPFDAMVPIDDSLKLRGWLEYSRLEEQQQARVPNQLFEWFRAAKSWNSRRIGEFSQAIELVVMHCQRLLDGFDFLLTPAMPIVNFPVNEIGVDPVMPLRHCTFTAPFNQSGQPALVMRAGFDTRGLPIGLQLVGRRFDDWTLLKVASELESILCENCPWPTLLFKDERTV